jgi:DNA-binding protein HU-beta
MAENYTKAKLIAELSEATAASKAAVGRMLDQLAAIAYREADNGFVVPGICKLKVVNKKASRCRNPATGKMFLIGERRGLKILPLKKAKMMITPNTGVTVQMLDDEPGKGGAGSEPVPRTEAAESAGRAEANSAGHAPAPVPESAPLFNGGEDGQIVFPCHECGSMLAASPKMSGGKGECPFCKAKTIIPHRQDGEAQTRKQRVEATGPAGLDFILFVCHACAQEIEAPADMVGMNVECPSCATSLTVPIAGSEKVPEPVREVGGKKGPNPSSMTIRIDLSDLE